MLYIYSSTRGTLRTLTMLTSVLALLVFSSQLSAYGWLSEEQEKVQAANVVGPIKSDDNCENCHGQESETWKETRHFATFKDQHKTPEAKKILKALGEKSMKRSAECRQCHYTSTIKKEKVKTSFGVSCESCHGPAKEWLPLHSKVGGDLAGEDLKWGEGKNESADQRATRLGKAQEKGMIHSDMIYSIAKNCFACHTVPNEKVVNTGGHQSGSDFELVSWSQGEVRHNFSSSAGAPDSPTNAASSIEKTRRLYVTGLMVDLETTLDNIAHVSEKGGIFHKAMVTRANKTKIKLTALLAKISIAELAPVLASLPKVFDESTDASKFPKLLSAATLRFLAAHDGSNLAAIDELIPTQTKGTPYTGS